ncbi:MAG: DUF4214 domain-containing protein [Pseudomonadota bacterium]
MTVSPREYAWMALDAYDSAPTPNDPDSVVLADPAVELEFPEWRVLPPEGEKAALRNATRTDMSGFEANIYVNDETQEIVIAFRGTEFGFFVDAATNAEFDLIDDANLDNDVESLFGYYQDGGATLKGIENEAGGFSQALQDTFGFSELEANGFEALLTIFGFVGDPVEELAEAGEEVVREQAREAVRLTLETAAANPGYEISVTGHSLGGALAAYTAAALGVQAVTFDPAPYGEQNWLAALRAETDALVAESFSDLDFEALGWNRELGPSFAASELVSVQRLEGSFVPETYRTASPLDLPGERSDTVIGPLGFGIDPFTLHSADLLVLILDSDIRETEERPDFESLMRALPNTLDEFDERDLSPDGATSTFFRTLLVEDAFYAFFAEVTGTLGSQYRGFAPEGAEVMAAREVERGLTEPLIEALPDLLEGPFDTFPSVDLFLPGAPGDGDDLVIGTYGRIDVLSGGLGADLIAPGEGQRDIITGTLAEHDGDTITEFSPGDRLVVTDAEVVAIETSNAGPGDRLVITAGDGREATLQVLAEFDGVTLRTFSEGGQAVIEPLPPTVLTLEEVQRVALFYEAVFDRQADDGGLNFWVGAMEDGLNEFALAERFLESAEFTGLYGDVFAIEDPEFIEILYTTALNRPSDEEGLAFWSERLDDLNYGREEAVISFALSDENMGSATGIDQIAQDQNGDWGFA